MDEGKVREVSGRQSQSQPVTSLLSSHRQRSEKQASALCGGSKGERDEEGRRETTLGRTGQARTARMDHCNRIGLCLERPHASDLPWPSETLLSSRPTPFVPLRLRSRDVAVRWNRAQGKGQATGWLARPARCLCLAGRFRLSCTLRESRTRRRRDREAQTCVDSPLPGIGVV